MNTTKKVSCILTLIFILTIFLSGCRIFNLSDFVLPDDTEFISCIKKLYNPEKICQYMKENFTYKENVFYNPDPYTIWLTREGDCNDYTAFAQFVANYNGYETWQILIYFKRTSTKHMLAVYLENGKYTYSSNEVYHPIYALSFKDIVLDYFNPLLEYELNYYKVFDYNMNKIEQK